MFKPETRENEKHFPRRQHGPFRPDRMPASPTSPSITPARGALMSTNRYVVSDRQIHTTRELRHDRHGRPIFALWNHRSLGHADLP
jgi:hypothetical protein